MPKNVHQEESLEQLIAVIKFHLDNNIYPEFDPVYRAGTKGKQTLMPCFNLTLMLISNRR